MRLLITGAGGLLGLNLALGWMHEHSVVGLDRGTLRNAPFDLMQIELTAAPGFVRALSEARPDAVVHCAAMADVDACERDPDMARRVNTDVPADIARVCQRLGVPLLHISTDAVFDGTTSAPYSEADRANPTSVYARTKLAAEGAVLETYPQAIVARVNFYGWSPTGRRSLAEFFVNGLSTGSRVKGFTDVKFNPMLVADLGGVLLRMLESGLTGLYHAVGPEPMTKYEFGVAIARTFGYDASLISRDSVETAGLVAMRAHNLVLSVHKLSTALKERLPGFSTGILKFYQQFMEGYPQLIRSYQQLSPEMGLARGSTLAGAGAGPE
jgi:dTDP-4-dehydrorhamnose reductase